MGGGWSEVDAVDATPTAHPSQAARPGESSVFHLLALTVGLAAPVPKDGRELRNADPPKEWKVADLAAAMPRRDDAGRVRVLAWEVIDTKRGFILEKALVLKELARPTDADEKFVLAYLYRHPRAEKPEWQLAEVSGTDFKPNGVPIPVFVSGFLLTAKPPPDTEFAALLARMFWADTLKGGKDQMPELTAGGVVYANWKAALNRDPPPALFPELKAK